MKRRILSVLFAMFVLAGMCWVSRADSGEGLQANSNPATGNAPAIRIAGSDAMHHRISTLCKLFMKDHPEANILVLKESLEDEGLEFLIGNRSEVAMASRRATIEEKEAASARGVELIEHPIGHGGIVILTHPSNPVDQLSLEQVQKIFTGEYTDWSRIGGANQPISIFQSAENRSGTLMFFEAEVLGGAKIVENAATLPDFLTLMQKVSRTPGAIGYTRIRDVFESPAGSKEEIKVLKIKKDDSSAAVAPSIATIQDGTYPLRRPYYLYTVKECGTEVRTLVEFIMSTGWRPQQQKTVYVWR